MREQKHNSTDLGWAAMQRILDREMPRRRRRAAGWWWLTGLLLLPLLGVAGWQVYQHSVQTVPAPASPAIPMAPIAEHSSANRTSTSTGPGVNLTIIAQESPTAATFQNFDKRNSGKRLNHATSTQTGPLLTNKAESTVLERFIPTRVEGVTLQYRTEAEKPIVAQTGVAPVSPLAMLPMSFPALQAEADLPDLPDYPDYTSPELTKKVMHRATWTFGAMAGVTSERLPRVNGGVIGLVADWQPLHHWGLRSGIQYAMQRLAADESLVTTISEDAYEKASNVNLLDNTGNYGNITDFSSINTNILASVRRIHRIETPLLVYWQPVRALRAYTGASLNYTFLAQTSPRIFADNQVFKVASGRDELNRLATEKLNRWQVKWQLGLGYRLGQRVEINASIQAALPKISLQKDSHLDSELQVVAERNSISIEQVRQIGVTLRGVVFF